VGVSFDSSADNASFAEEEGFGYELWSDLDRTLAMHYGAASSASQSMADRITVLLDAEGVWRVEYAPASVVSNAADVLEDCEALFGP
jgi:peroxiredoxin